MTIETKPRNSNETIGTEGARRVARQIQGVDTSNMPEANAGETLMIETYTGIVRGLLRASADPTQ